MKIYQIPNGARFLYQGEEYVKTGPMFGLGKDGQKVIPRYAVLQPIEPATGLVTDATLAAAGQLPRESVLRAFGVFFGECQNLVDVERRAALDRAKTQFLKAIG